MAFNNVFRFLCCEPRNSASHMFVSRGLPVCKMLIRKKAFIISTKRSRNTILKNSELEVTIYTRFLSHNCI